MAYCPSNENLNEWLRTIFAEIAASYEVDGFDLTHCRYTAPAFLHNLFGCGCPRCASLAAERGYDFEKMRHSVLAFWERIHHLDARAVREAGERGVGLLDLSQWLGVDAGLVQWFEFRAGVITANLKLFKETACEAAGRDIVFGSEFLALLCVAYNGIMEARMTLGETVVVFGLGVVGQLTCQLARWSGARRVGGVPARTAPGGGSCYRCG